jgi:ABC-type cobalamin/Fe3+-siderophores transport system ATPase subunit
VTHDAALAARYARKALHMTDGKLLPSEVLP